MSTTAIATDTTNIATRKMGGYIVTLDAEDLRRVNAYKWRINSRELRRNGRFDFRATSIYGKNISLRRFLVDAPPGMKVIKIAGTAPFDFRKVCLEVVPAV